MNQSEPKKCQKDATDGLTKKERRALKLSSKNVSEKKVGLNDNLKIDVKKDNNISKNDSSAKNIEKQTTTTEVKLGDDKKNKSDISKAELRAQRRAIQEAQRLAKQQKQQENTEKQSKPETKIVKNIPKIVDKPKPEKMELSLPKTRLKESKIQLFSHLSVATTEKGNVFVNNIHPAFVRLGAQYASKTILGSNARCLALLSAIKSLILNFETPSNQEFCRSLEVALQNCVTYLQNYRLLAVSMINALRYFKLVLADLNTSLSDNDKKDTLINWVNDYMNDEIAKAGEAISMKVEEKISNDDLILTYGCSSLVIRILLEAHTKNKKRFKVIVVDSNPLFEGREMLRRLVNAGIQCTYVLINAVGFVMNKTTKVLLGAHALLANGYVMSRIGTAQIALMAKAYSKPVLVCCETYKFCERVQTDSIVFNEIGNPYELVRAKKKQNDNPISKLSYLNLMYDVTPPDLVTAVATELAILPCTSVPVILRIDLEKTKK